MAVDLAAEFTKNDSPCRENVPAQDPIFTIQARVALPRLAAMGWIQDMRGVSGSLYFRVMPPCAALKPFVRYYWVLKCPDDAPRADEYLAPDGFEELIFSCGAAWRRDETRRGERSSAVLDGSYLVGCKSAGVTCARLGPLNMIGIKLWPQALHSLLRTPLREFGSTYVHLRDLPRGPLHDLESRLADCADEASIRQTLDECLSRLPLAGRRSDLVEFSLRRIFTRRGDITIDELANDTSAHYRTVEKRFADHVGLAPKTLARTIRFKHAMHLLQDTRAIGRTPITRLADLGYYDQSHFVRDFHWFTGTTPGKFLRSQPGLSIDVFRFCLDLDLNAIDQHAGSGFVL